MVSEKTKQSMGRNSISLVCLSVSMECSLSLHVSLPKSRDQKERQVDEKLNIARCSSLRVILRTATMFVATALNREREIFLFRALVNNMASMTNIEYVLYPGNIRNR